MNTNKVYTDAEWCGDGIITTGSGIWDIPG
jgi:hypothetical protein